MKNLIVHDLAAELASSLTIPSHETYHPCLFQNPAHCSGPRDAAQGGLYASPGHGALHCRTRFGGPIVQRTRPVPIQDLPFLHQGAPGNAPAVTEYPAH